MGERDYISTTAGLLAEVRELAGAPADAAALSDQAAMLFERKGNVVSALRARQLAERLRSTPAARTGWARGQDGGWRHP